MKHRRFSVEQHVSTGQSLKRIIEEIEALRSQVSDSYPRATGIHDGLTNAVSQLNIVRSTLEDALFREHGDSASTFVYYGNDLGERV